MLRRCLATALAFLMLLIALPVRAAGLSLLRDAEIEAYLHDLTKPIFIAADLDPDSIDILIVNDPALNAFVAGGQNLFLNSGLLMRAETPDQLAGVIAHETGHIAGGHLSRQPGAQSAANYKALLGALLGAAAALAGAPQLAAPLILGGTGLAQTGLIAFTRGQEEKADQAAVTYLGNMQMSPQGLLDFFQILQNETRTLDSGANPFMRSHPLTTTRISFIEQQVAKSPFRDRSADKKLVVQHNRMLAKLRGFLDPPDETLALPFDPKSLTDRYERAIALYRKPDLKAALTTIDGLIADYPKDPFFRELKGQMLFENGRLIEAEAPYRDAVKLDPRAPLLKFGLARVLIEQATPDSLPRAATLLREALVDEPRNASYWRFLGLAYGKGGQEGRAELALTQAAVLTGNNRDAQRHLTRAEALITPNDKAWLELQDATNAVGQMPPPVRRSPFARPLTDALQ